MKKERRDNEKWNMLVVQGILVVFAIPVLYLAKKEKKKEKRERGICWLCSPAVGG